jgi:hypothetical protein
MRVSSEVNRTEILPEKDRDNQNSWNDECDNVRASFQLQIELTNVKAIVKHTIAPAAPMKRTQSISLSLLRTEVFGTLGGFTRGSWKIWVGAYTATMILEVLTRSAMVNLTLLHWITHRLISNAHRYVATDVEKVTPTTGLSTTPSSHTIPILEILRPRSLSEIQKGR